MDRCIALMESVLASLSRGETLLPLRSILWLPEKAGALGLMPAYLGGEKALGVKVVSFFPRNEDTALDSHQGAVLLFDPETGSLLAVIDATSITAIRTAAVSGVATRALAREDATDLALVGSGVQARTHLEAMLAVRPVRRVRVASHRPERAAAFARRESARWNIPVEPASSVRAAVEGAEIICVATSSRTPVLQGDWISAGAHVNAVGSSVASARELDTDAVRRSRLYVDRLESAIAEAGDFVMAKNEGAIGDAHIVAEIGDVLAGSAPGRGSAAEITLFKSVGLAVEDVACARFLADRARGEPDVLEIELGGARDAD